MTEKIFYSLIQKYDQQSENSDVWKKFKTELEDETDLTKLNDLDAFIENLGITINKKLLDQKGYSVVENDIINIYIDFTNPEKVNRFILAHELAHIIFDYSRLINGERINSNYMENELFHDQSEVRANQFAAELLMPSKSVIAEVDKMFEDERRSQGNDDVTLTTESVIPTLVNLYNVSYSAVENRLKNLGMVK